MGTKKKNLQERESVKFYAEKVLQHGFYQPTNFFQAVEDLFTETGCLVPMNQFASYKKY